MKQKNRKASRRGKSRTSSERRVPNESYKIVGSTVIVTCPEGHKSQGQKVSDRLVEQELVCANPSCNAEWTETLPQIASLEEA